MNRCMDRVWYNPAVYSVGKLAAQAASLLSSLLAVSLFVLLLVLCLNGSTVDAVAELVLAASFTTRHSL